MMLYDFQGYTIKRIQLPFNHLCLKVWLWGRSAIPTSTSLPARAKSCLATNLLGLQMTAAPEDSGETLLCCSWIPDPWKLKDIKGLLLV